VQHLKICAEIKLFFEWPVLFFLKFIVISANRENAECDPHSNNTSAHQASKQQQQQQQQLLHQYRLNRNFNHHFRLH